jgi:hypothetical protein
MLTVAYFKKKFSFAVPRGICIHRIIDVMGYLKTWLKATYHLVKCWIDVVCKLDLTNRLPPHCS